MAAAGDARPLVDLTGSEEGCRGPILSAGTADGCVVRGKMAAGLGCCSSCGWISCGADTAGAQLFLPSVGGFSLWVEQLQCWRGWDLIYWLVSLSESFPLPNHFSLLFLSHFLFRILFRIIPLSF